MPVTKNAPSHIKPPTDEPVFNSFKRKPLRPFYFLVEFRLGLVLLLVLAVMGGWVAWRGMHPDPQLFHIADEQLTNKGKEIPIYERPVEPWIEPGSLMVAATAGGGAGPALGPFPPTVVSEGWRAAGPAQMFDVSNLYNKIDGRETFYKAYGFQFLHFLSLISTANPDLYIDIELFDLGTVENALGALVGEISNPGQAVTLNDAGLWYATVNGGFLARGRYYARLIGSDDAAVIREKIAELRVAFSGALPAEPLPWAYALFVGELQLSPAAVRYDKENAFSFGFANEFYSARLPGSDAEVLISRRTNADEAAALAKQLQEGFLAFGKLTETGLVHNEMINSYDAARVAGRDVIGVRFAPSAAVALEWLDKLTAAAAKIKAEPPPAAAPAAAPAAQPEEYRYE